VSGQKIRMALCLMEKHQMERNHLQLLMMFW